MGLFSSKKTHCDVCGAEIKVSKGCKLKDGIICRACEYKASTFFKIGCIHTVEQVRSHLAYREENKRRLQEFNVTRVLGPCSNIVVDENAGLFAITKMEYLNCSNPDLISFSDIMGCELKITSKKIQDQQYNSAGEVVQPLIQRYTYQYDFKLLLQINNPYFKQVTVNVSPAGINVPESSVAFGLMMNPEYAKYHNEGEELKNYFLQKQHQMRQVSIDKNKAHICPHCGATTVPDKYGCCEYCTGVLG